MGVNVHLLHPDAPIFDRAPRHDLEVADLGVRRHQLAAAKAVPLSREHDDGAAFEGFVSQRCELRRIRRIPVRC
jgi:hypothetical protein